MVLLPGCVCCDVCSKEDSNPDEDTEYDVEISGSSESFFRCVGLPASGDVRITQRLVVATMADSTTAAVVISNNGLNQISEAFLARFSYFGVAAGFGNNVPGASPARAYDRAQAYLAGGLQTQECCFDLSNASNGVTIEAEWRRIGDSWTLYSSKLDGVASSLSGTSGLVLPASARYVWHGITGTNGGKTYTSYYMKIEYL
jgi:hypothetical protein